MNHSSGHFAILTRYPRDRCLGVTSESRSFLPCPKVSGVAQRQRFHPTGGIHFGIFATLILHSGRPQVHIIVRSAMARTTSPLADRLPAELRVEIYKLALRQEKKLTPYRKELDPFQYYRRCGELCYSYMCLPLMDLQHRPAPAQSEPSGPGRSTRGLLQMQHHQTRFLRQMPQFRNGL